MDQEPYEAWADRVCAWLDRYGLKRETSAPADTDTAGQTGETPGPADSSPDAGDALREEANIVVDLGCGTGKLTEILADRGYDMIGIDLSEDMLGIAQERRMESGRDILYTLQDMRDFELYGAAGAMVSVGDSINYLLEEADLEAMFRCVHRSLLPGGIFVFDFKTVHLYRDVIGYRTIAEDRGDCAFIWDNYYDPETCVNEYDLAVFVAADGSDGSLFRRFDEVHRQRGYRPEQLRAAAERAGLIWIDMQDVVTGGPVDDETERAMAAVRRENK
ncbi:MAG: class I SAM-dependent methyltransferase [Lachnospiraceae bacterium]|nr:class I SAM-dependent methyltransferase [Lachnospiraceae bacterium]